MYSRSLARANVGSCGAANMRLMMVAERPDALWFALSMVQVVLRGRSSASACSSSVTNPAVTKASPSALILDACRAFIAATTVAGLGRKEQTDDSRGERVGEAGQESDITSPFSDRLSLSMPTTSTIRLTHRRWRDGLQPPNALLTLYRKCVSS